MTAAEKLAASGRFVIRPGLSLYRTDVAVHGADLDDYLFREFGIGTPGEPRRPTVNFWSSLVR